MVSNRYLVGWEHLPELSCACDGSLHSRAVLPAEEVGVELGGGEEELERGTPELGSGGGPGGQCGERGCGYPVDSVRGRKLRLEVAGPEQRLRAREEPRRGCGAEEANPPVEHVLLRRDGADDRVGAGEEGQGQQLEPRRRGGERGDEEQGALEVRLGGGGGAGAGTAAAGAEEEGREAEPRPGLGEREEPRGVGRAERSLEAGGGCREVAPALGLVGQREEAVRQRRHGAGRDGRGISGTGDTQLA